MEGIYFVSLLGSSLFFRFEREREDGKKERERLNGAFGDLLPPFVSSECGLCVSCQNELRVMVLRTLVYADWEND